MGKNEDFAAKNAMNGTGATFIVFAPCRTDLYSAAPLLDQIRAAMPDVRIETSRDLAEASARAKTSDRVLVLLSSAGAALESAARRCVPMSATLTEWLAHAREVEALREEIGSKVVLTASDAPMLTPDLAKALGVPLSAVPVSVAAPIKQDDILSLAAAAALHSSPDAQALSARLNAWRADPAPEDGAEEIADIDAVLSRYWSLCSEIEEMRSLQDGRQRQLARAQENMRRQTKAIANAASQESGDRGRVMNHFHQTMDQGGDQRRRRHLRGALTHHQTMSDLGPLTPRAISAPFLTRRLKQLPSVGMNPAHAINGDLRPGESTDLAPLLRLKETTRLAGSALEIHSGSAGHQFYGPYLKLTTGEYRLDASLMIRRKRSIFSFGRGRDAVLEIVCGDEDAPIMHRIPCGPTSKTRQDVSLSFAPPADRPIAEFEVRLWTDGATKISFGSITLHRLHRPAPFADRPV